MTLTDRDRKIVLVLVPIVLVAAFLFLVMKPKREEAARAAKTLSEQRQRRDAAVARERQLLAAKQSFASDYLTVVRLGKAVPTDVDMPSVLVQLEKAARGTGINFGDITAQDRIPAAGGSGLSSTSGSASSGSSSSGSSSSAPVAAGGQSAQSTTGKTVEKANNSAASQNQSAAASSNTSAETNTQTSTSSKPGGLPVGGSAGGSSSSSSGGPVPVAGLDTVPLELGFDGGFFSLADFFHRLKRFVEVANGDLAVKGRLMTVDSFSFSSDQTFPKLKATLKARIFLAPKAQGPTQGASPAGPATASGAGSTASASDSTPSTTAAAPSVAGP